jgi:GNAT superfamily N-acetyltransferase
MIRSCGRDDRDRILDIINDAAEAYRAVIPPDRWHDPYMSGDEIDRELAAGVAFLGWDDSADGLTGVMGAQDVRDVTLIRHAYVRTARRGQGIGGSLLAALMADIDRPVLIGTWRAADWAIRFYEKNGFCLLDRDETTRLLRSYWSIPDRQIETSVVLAGPGYQPPP